MKNQLSVFLSLGLLSVTGASFAQNTFPNPGNVGIGTTTPSTSLEIYHGTPIITLFPASYAGNYKTTLGTGSSAQGYLILGNNGLNEIRAGNSNTGGYLDFRTNNTKSQDIASDGILAMRLAANGNIGIGLTAPSEKLSVNGNINIFDPTGGTYLGFGTANSNEYNTIGSMYASAGLVLAHGLKPSQTSQELIYSHGNMARSAIVLGRGFSEGGIKFYVKPAGVETVGATFATDVAMQITDGGNVGIGTPSPSSRLTISGALSQETSRMSIVNSEGGQAIIETGISGVSNNGLAFKLANADGSNSNINMVIGANGNIGMGTTTPNEKLAVNGKIRAKEIKVETANWPDYVFEEGYKVGTLEELEGYIKANKRLPEMPSAKEAEANGVELGEMNKLLLKKVEELTLLLIDQNKKNEKQEQAIDELRKELEKVKSKK